MNAESKSQRGCPGREEGERGSALIMALVVLFLLAATGIALLFLGDTDTRMNLANVRDKRTFFIAEAGLEAGRERLRLKNLASVNTTKFTEEVTAAAGPNGVIDFTAAGLAAVYDASGNVTGFAGYGDDVPLLNNTALAGSAPIYDATGSVTGFTGSGSALFNGGRYAAFLTNDAVDGETSKTDTNQRVMITAIGAGPNRAIKKVQAIVEKITLPTLPAMITLIGPPATSPATNYDDGASSVKLMVGDDCVGAAGYSGVAGYYVPVVGAFGAAATAQAAAGANSGVYSSGSETGSATVHDVSGTASSMWSDCTYLHDLADTIRGSADAICTVASPCSNGYWSATTNSSVTFVDRDLSLTGGKGLIWVTGTLTISGANSFEGTLLVIGEGVLNRQGGGSGHSYGAIVVADIAGPDGIYGNGDDCTGGMGGFAAPTYSISGAGNHDHIYCSQAMTVSMDKLAVKVAQFRQF